MISKDFKLIIFINDKCELNFAEIILLDNEIQMINPKWIENFKDIEEIYFVNL